MVIKSLQPNKQTHRQPKLFLSASFYIFFEQVNLAKKQSKLEKELREWLNAPKRVAIAGIGNPIRSDDYVGTKIIQELQGKTSPKITLLECETVPESFVDEIGAFKPTHVLLIDAALMGLKPGEVRLLNTENIKNFPAISTNMLPLPVLCEFIAQLTGAKIALILIEPKNTEMGEELTAEVQNSAEIIVRLLLKLLP
jgi:hydrogenase 3 maturation protease